MKGNEHSYSKWRASVIAYAPLFLWIAVIFFFSSPEGSFAQTSRIIGPLLHFFYPDISFELETQIHAVVRKCAHFTEYAVLALLAVRGFSASASNLLKKWRYILPLIIVAVVASLDEFNQSFEASRTSSFWDVLLDFAGGVAMIAVLWLIKRPRSAVRTER